jgi:hypothetical protein
MTHSLETTVLVNVAGYGSMLLALLYIWLRTEKVGEEILFLKLIGYTYLSMFRFTFNQVALPLGLLLAFYLLKKTKQNKTIKQRAVILGAVLFLAGFVPIADYIEQALYPRDRMETYLMRDLEGKGFHLHFASPEKRSFKMLTEKDEAGRQMYQAIRQSSQLVDRDKLEFEGYQMTFHQDQDDERFEELVFDIGTEGRYLRLHVENHRYLFQTTPEFQRMVQEVIAEYKRRKK